MAANSKPNTRLGTLTAAIRFAPSGTDTRALKTDLATAQAEAEIARMEGNRITSSAASTARDGKAEASRRFKKNDSEGTTS